MFMEQLTGSELRKRSNMINALTFMVTDNLFNKIAVYQMQFCLLH
jgi:hypothetical protein